MLANSIRALGWDALNFYCWLDVLQPHQNDG